MYFSSKTLGNWLALFCFAFALFLTSCQQDSETNSDQELSALLESQAPNGLGTAFFELPESNDFSKIPQDPRNPITAQKVALGKLLFHEPGLLQSPKSPDGKNSASCASCHHAEAGFAAGIAQGIGEGGIGFGLAGEGRLIDPSYDKPLIDVQAIKTPSAMNTAWQRIVLWNGQFGANGDNVGTEANWTPGTPKEKNNLGFDGIETQAVAGLGVHRLMFQPDYIKGIPTYKYLFDAVFADVPESDRYSIVNAGLAIAAYERTLLANQSPWQLWLKGQKNALAEEEKEGALLFFGKAGCSRCHTGPALNSMAFYCIGLNDLTEGNYGAINVTAANVEHKGRGGFTGNDDDLYQFKVPQLYNLKDVNFYGHGSSITSIRDMVAYKNEAVGENSILPASRMASAFVPLNLTESEIDAITAFLENGLYDPNLQRYVPDHLPTGNCFPNNDAQSRLDRGCD